MITEQILYVHAVDVVVGDEVVIDGEVFEVARIKVRANGKLGFRFIGGGQMGSVPDDELPVAV